ncbi:probable insulin-like peptide 7 [Gigantopelta aegis]|uniref:probable insulin-like peptide 7 n=1 Tax=Gigantopelta aegis TaxID=1735272 RepID=UPI001B88E2F0|nr:probable insulin-like peptide 7 [Gigantopelta aegis]
MATKDVNFSSVCQRFAYLGFVWMAVCCAVISPRKMPRSGFKELVGTEVFNVWHTDCPRGRSRQLILNRWHLACELDPYSQIHRADLKERKRTPFLEKHYSKLFLNKREEFTWCHGGSIMEECCYKKCSWEELGEYCEGNKPRLIHVGFNNCENDVHW